MSRKIAGMNMTGVLARALTKMKKTVCDENTEAIDQGFGVHGGERAGATQDDRFSRFSRNRGSQLKAQAPQRGQSGCNIN